MEKLLYIIFVFLLGLIAGSFFNCLSYRIFNKEDFVVKRSHCPKCKHTLRVLDLIPLFSYLFLFGKCRYCQKKISWQYFLSELITGLIFVLVFLFSPSLIVFFFNILMVSFFAIIFICDLNYLLIPDAVIFPAIATAFLANIGFDILNGNNIFSFNSFFIRGSLGGAIAGLFFSLIVLISREKWMGKGDIFLGLMIGFFLGFPKIIPALFLAFFIGATVSLVLVSLKKKGLKSEVPFGPFLMAGTLISLFWGEYLISWYMGLIF